MFLKIELPHFDHRILYCEIGNDFSVQSGGYVSKFAFHRSFAAQRLRRSLPKMCCRDRWFPLSIHARALSLSHHHPLPFAPSLPCSYTVMDPEILYADNLVENKHKLLTRSRRRGPHDQDLKPNPATRDILAALTTRPSSDPLTSVEKDLIWRFRFYLSKNKKALTKFLYGDLRVILTRPPVR